MADAKQPKGAGDKPAATDPKDKKGGKKQSAPTVLLPVQIVRVRCACDSHDPPAPPPPPPPKVVSRDAKHKDEKKGKSAPVRKPPADPWIRGLYVVWAPKPADGQSVAFAIAQTDLDGHLSIPGDSPDTFKIATHEGQEFLFWFVRHADPKVARDVRDAVSKGDRKTYGPGFSAKLVKDAPPDPCNLTLSYTATGKDAKSQQISEPVLSIPANPSFFVPEGSKLYDGWTIYKLALPNPKKKNAPCDVQPFEQCLAVQAQVERLQHHLGALRFLVGDHGHPYVPTAPGGGSYPNVGVFEIITWNSVLRFQSEATSGSAYAVPSRPHDQLLAPLDARPANALDAHWGAPKPLATALTEEAFAVGRQYVNAKPASGVATFSFATPGLVCATTGAAIAHWLQQGYRKPGGIMVTWYKEPGVDTLWLREKAFAQVSKLDAKLQALGFTHGVHATHTFRDARVDALGAGFGRAKRSIHKTGFAIDMYMSGYQPTSAWPIQRTMERDAYEEEQAVEGLEDAEHSPEAEPAKGAPRAGHRVKVQWRLFAPVDGKKSEAAADQGYYVTQITPWQYDPTSPMGGTQLPPVDGTFIDFTAVALDCGYVRIHSFGDDDLGKQDWRGGPRLLPCSDPKELTGVLEELSQVLGNKKLADAEIWLSPAVMDKDFRTKTHAERKALLEAAGATCVKVSSIDPAEIDAVSCWIGFHGAKNLPPDLSVKVEYHLKAVKDPDKTEQLLNDQLKTHFAKLLAKRKVSRELVAPPIDGWACECLALEDDADAKVKAGDVIATVKLTEGSLQVGDGKDAFPKKSFAIRPARPTLAKNLPYTADVYFPQTVGEPIGMEWWHFQLADGLLMKEEDLAQAKAQAKVRGASLDAEIEKADTELTQARADAKAKGTEAAKKAVKQASTRLNELKRQRSAEKAVEGAAHLPGTWWSMIHEIGWTEEALRAMGYNDKDKDFTSEAH